VSMRDWCRGRGGSEHGAAAVEMALVLPLLILLIGGVIDFGFMFNAQISATHAAREGVRVEAIGTGDAAQAAENAFFAPAATSLGAQIVRSCPHDDGALLRMRASYDFFFLPFGQRTLTGEAVMRCNG
jgi:Flp pilus assembly protein TadG